MAEATKTTTPRATRSRKPAATTAAKTTPPVAETPKADGKTKVAVTLGEAFQETKTYAKFDLSKDADGNATGMVGTMYAPLGTEEVKVLLVGPEDIVE